MFKSLRNEKGFTMIEMMVVLIIIAVLIAGGIKFYLGYIENAKVTKAKGNITTMQAAMDAYYAENYAYPVEKDQFLNAGITISSGDASPFTADQKDPWGVNYNIEVETSKYSINTGYDEVQGKKNTVVKGTGDTGKSEQPFVKTEDAAEG